MKRVLIFLAMFWITIGTVAATTTLARELRDLLQRSLIRERQTVARYEQFAQKADEEGYAGAAALFRAQAKAESTHALRFASLLREYGVEAPAEEPYKADVGSTRENLASAAAAERAERDGDYREAVDACNLHGHAELALIFDQTRDTEVEHANLCMAAGRDLESMRAAKTYYVCGKCGYTTDVKLPFCPSCQHDVPPAAIH